MKMRHCNRRHFLHHTVALAAGAPLAFKVAQQGLFAAETPATAATPARAARMDSRVAIVGCTSYGPEVRAAMAKAFDLVGGIGSLVKDKTVTVKLNLTGTNFTPFLERPLVEASTPPSSTALPLASP